MKTAIYIPAHNGPELRHGEFTDEDIRELVAGPFQTIKTFSDGTGFINEYAKQKMRKNEFATMLLAAQIGRGDYIAGPILIMGSLEDDGSPSSVSVAMIDLCVECWNEFQRWGTNDLG